MALHGLGRQLSWKDYRKVETSPDGNDAGTHIDTSHNGRWINSGKGWAFKHVTVGVTINPQKSWVVAGQESDELLRHEQIHYQIAAIAARQLERELSKLKGDASMNPDRAYDQTVTKIIGKGGSGKDTVVDGLLQKVQYRYDEGPVSGSRHGRSTHYQRLWDHAVTNAFGDPSAELEDLYWFLQPGDFNVDLGLTRTA
jgi:hypothetical protein